jgi:outer membrane lipoprotein-sorting protein
MYLRLKRPLFLIAPVVLSIAAVACGGDSKGGGLLVSTVAPQGSGQTAGSTPAAGGGTATGGANVQPTKPAATASSGGNTGGSNSELTTLFSNFSKVKSFKATATTAVSSGGGQQTITMEVVTPDKLHFTTSGGSTGALEFISIGNDNYIKLNGTWTKQPGAGSGKIFDPKSFNDSIQAASADEKAVTKGGTDTVNGKKCQIYTNSTPGGGSTEICVADGLPLRVVTKGTSGTTQVIFSDFNANIDIKAPI